CAMERKIERILTGLYQKNILKKYQIIPTETEKVFYISVSFLPTDRPDRNMLTAGFLWNMTGVPLEENDLNIFDDGNELDFENFLSLQIQKRMLGDDTEHRALAIAKKLIGNVFENMVITDVHIAAP